MIKCAICETTFEKRVSFCNHIHKKHDIKAKDYYDMYLKSSSEEGICKYKNCSNPTVFLDVEKGYKECCCLEHTNLYRYGVKSNLNFSETKEKAQKNSHTKEALEKQAQTNLLRYGVRTSLLSKQAIEKTKQTCLDRYNVDNAFKSNIIQEKARQTRLNKYGDANYNNREKAKQTCLNKYGVESPMQTNEVKQKQKTTSLKRYGTEHPTSSQIVKDKIKQTNLSRYGVEAITATQHFKNKTKETLQAKYGVNNCQQFKSVCEQSKNTRANKITQFETECNCTNIGKLKTIYGQGFLAIKNNLTLYNDRGHTFVANADIQKIIDYNSTHTRSRVEDEIIDFIKTIYSGKIIHDDRQIIKPLELDIYIPDKNLAIEYDSIYYHSQLDKNYHLMKTKKCEDANIHLIHIFEYEWFNHKEICKSIIKSSLNIFDTIINAKDCQVQLVNDKDANKFVAENCLQNKPIKSTYNLGLYYNTELVQLMCLSKPDTKQEDVAQIYRFCTKLNTKIIDGLITLLNYQPYKNLTLFLDRAKFNCNEYLTIGFVVADFTNPTYKVYYKGKEFENNKTSLIGEDNKDFTNQHWFQIYNCGEIKLNLQK